MTTIYGIKNCDTMQKALKWLDAKNIEYVFHDYKKEGITKAMIAKWLKHFAVTELINTKGTTWKKLNDKEKESIKNINEAIEIIISQPSMIKRPLVDFNGKYLLGFNPDTWKEYIS